MKKLLAIVMAAMLVALLLPGTALAHGSHRGGRQKYYVCNVEDCERTCIHRHNGTSYSAHYYGDGHDYHGYCEIEDCTLRGYHEHDGEYCFGHTVNDGHSYHHTVSRSGRGHH